MTDPLLVAKAGDTELVVLPAMANRHGLITGATGTGKTVTLQVLAEQFSRIGVPVFCADVKGDLSGIAKAGAMSDKLGERLEKLSLPKSADAAFAEGWYEAPPVKGLRAFSRVYLGWVFSQGFFREQE